VGSPQYCRYGVKSNRCRLLTLDVLAPQPWKLIPIAAREGTIDR
jgi:hypothetical protein